VQGRPSLVIGDTVYLRVADNPATEAAAAMVSMRGTQALLALPPEFRSMVEVSMQTRRLDLACMWRERTHFVL